MMRSFHVPLVLAVVAASSAAFAEDVTPENVARATKLFEEGRVAIDAGRIDEACDRFAQSLALNPLIGTRLNLADCRERQGKLIEAYDLYEQSVAQAQQINKAGRLKFASEHRDALAAKLVAIRLHVMTDASGLVLRLTSGDGTRELARADWERLIVVVPGKIEIEASAPDHEPRTERRDGVAGTTLDIEIVAGPAKGQDVKPPPPPPSPPPLGRSRTGLIVGGVGLGLVAVSLGLGVSAKLKYDDAFDKPNVDDEIDSAQLRADIATGVAIAGAIAIGIGIVLHVKSGNDDRVSVTPTSDGTSAGLALVGGF